MDLKLHQYNVQNMTEAFSWGMQVPCEIYFLFVVPAKKRRRSDLFVKLFIINYNVAIFFTKKTECRQPGTRKTAGWESVKENLWTLIIDSWMRAKHCSRCWELSTWRTCYFWHSSISGKCFFFFYHFRLCHSKLKVWIHWRFINLLKVSCKFWSKMSQQFELLVSAMMKSWWQFCLQISKAEYTLFMYVIYVLYNHW